LATVNQHPLSIVAEIKAGSKAALNEKLTVMGKDPAANPEIPFGQVPTLHFSCFVIIDQEADKYPTYLVFESNFDGDLDAHLDQLLAVGQAGFDALFSHCVGYTPGSSADQLKAYMRSHSSPAAAFYVGCRGQTVQDIQNAIAVREEVENYLDSEQAKEGLDGLPAQAILEKIQAHLGKPGVVSPKISSETLPQLRSRAKRNIVLMVLFGLPILVLTFPLLILWLVIFRLTEIRDNHKKPLPPLPVDPRLFENPDVHTISHLTTMVAVKPGAIRWFTLKGVLAITSLLAKTVSIYGNLLGIPTIHFARWIMMDGNKRMLFFSNYDGSWASYLGDFVDQAKYGLTAIWGNTTRFPPSKWLAFGGAANIIQFKEWSRQHNVYAPIFYRAYPSATIANLLKDIEIRDNVGRSMSESEAAAFLLGF